MYINYILSSIILVIIIFTISCNSSYVPKEVYFDITVNNNDLTNEPKTLKVKHNDYIKLNIQSDEITSIHIHGYDIEKEITPDKVELIEFKASATGRFDITIHKDTNHNNSHSHSHSHNEQEDAKCEHEFPMNNTDSPSINIDIFTGENPDTYIIDPNILNFTLVSDKEKTLYDSKNNNIGHWHLYINGKLKSMYYEKSAILNKKEFDSGENVIKVILSSLNHCEYNISDTTTLEIKSKDHNDDHSHHDDSDEIQLAILEVTPN